MTYLPHWLSGFYCGFCSVFAPKFQTLCWTSSWPLLVSCCQNSFSDWLSFQDSYLPSNWMHLFICISHDLTKLWSNVTCKIKKALASMSLIILLWLTCCYIAVMLPKIAALQVRYIVEIYMTQLVGKDSYARRRDRLSHVKLNHHTLKPRDGIAKYHTLIILFQISCYCK